jgi:hypothetical protein
MRSRLTIVLSAAAFVVSASMASATNAPDFAAIQKALSSGAAASQPVVQNVDFSKAEPNIMGYIAAISKKANQGNVPFAKLAQQFIWNGPQPNFASDDTAVDREGRGPFKPFIMVGGYWETEVDAQTGGEVTLLCYVSDPDGPQDIDFVELYYNQQPTAVRLADDGTQGDFAANDQVYGLKFQIAPPNLLPAGQYLLELVAQDKSGNKSDMWPYLTIN